MKKRIGEILLERGLIDVDQLNSALAHQRQWGMRLGTALVARGFIAEGVLTRVLAESLAIPMVDLSRVVIDQKALALLPRRIAEQYDVFPIALQEAPNRRRTLLLAMADPLNATAIDEIGFTTDCIVKPAIAQISSLEQAIRRYYYGQRVDVAPLSFDRRGPAGSMPDEMTILTRDGEERIIKAGGTPPAKPAPIDLTDEVSTRNVLPPPVLTAAPPDYAVGQPTGVFSMAERSDEGEPVAAPADMAMPRAADFEALEALEKKYWALMRILARRGIVTKEEFLAELRAGDDGSRT